MKLDEKRKVVEVLLWAGSDANTAVSIAGCEFDVSIMRRALSAHYVAWTNILQTPTNESTYEIAAVEAAYRLIESSATLRREWFGR